MAAIRYMSTVDPTQTASGVIITEVTPPAVVLATQQTRALVAGETVRGPIDKAIDINSPNRLTAVFGGRDTVTGGPITNHVWQSLIGATNGQMTIVRAAADDAVAATITFNDTATPVLTVTASSVGAWGNGITATISDATDGDADHFNLTVKWRINESAQGGGTQVFTNLDISATGNDNLAKRVSTDDAIYVTVAKLVDGRPDNAADSALTTGSDGTIDDADFTGSGRALDAAAAAPGVGHVHVASRSNSAMKTAIAAKAGASTDRYWLVGPDDETVTLTAAIAEAGALARSDALAYCYGHVKKLDPETANLIVVEPMDLMSNELARLPVHLGPGTVESAAFHSGVAEFASILQGGLADADYDAAFVAGIAALERDAQFGFMFRDGVNTFLQDGTDRYSIARRRQVWFLGQNLGQRAKNDINKPNTSDIRLFRTAAANAFLSDLMRNQIIVDRAEDGQADGFTYDTESGATEADRVAGLQKDICRVRRIPEARIINLFMEVGTTVTLQVGTDGSVSEV